MQGSLTLHRGTLFVGRHEKTAHVRCFDLDGRALTDGFSFRDPRTGRSVAAGLAVDDDRHVWVADTVASRVRLFTVFGSEIGGLGVGLDEDLTAVERTQARGRVRRPVDVCVRGDSDAFELLVASGGERRHAVQLFDESGQVRASFRSEGNPERPFRDVAGVARAGRRVYVAERRAARVQVFRDGEFHFAFALHPAGGRFEPRAVAPLEDGRVVVAHAGPTSQLLLCDATGRLLRVLAPSGAGEGAVHEPNDVVVEEGEEDRHTRVAVIDRDGERVQVFTLEGRSLGAFEGLAG